MNTPAASATTAIVGRAQRRLKSPEKTPPPFREGGVSTKNAPFPEAEKPTAEKNHFPLALAIHSAC